MSYKKKDQQDYFEMLRKKKEEAVAKSLALKPNPEASKKRNADMTDAPVVGTLKELLRGGREDRK